MDKIKVILGIINIKSKKREDVLREICEVIPKIFLSAKKTSLKDLLKNINDKDQNKYQEAVSIIFEETKISKFLNNPFLFFDEYIDSGTTLNNYQYYLNFITKTNFKIVSYQIMINKTKEFPSIYYTLYDLDTQLKCYNFGIYPFENRIDLIGYYYLLSNGVFNKFVLDDMNLIKDEIDLNEFIIKLNKTIADGNLFNTIKNKFKIKDVWDFINELHVLRYYLFVLEKESKIDYKFSEFLWLSFDMYGPIWSPLPNEYHLEFMKIFEKSYKLIKESKGFKEILETYKVNREAILSQIVTTFIERRKKWLNSINPLIN